MNSEFENLDKIYKCLESCETVEQFNNAFSMLFRYNSIKKPNNESVLLFMTQVENYALLKKEEFCI